MGRKANLSILLFFILFTNAFAQTNQELFALGNQQFEAKKYTEAIKSYSTIYQSGDMSAELFLNLGNAYYNVDSLSKAVLNYERGLKLSPNGKALKTNLAIVNDKIDADILDMEAFVLVRWWRSVAQSLPLNIWAIIQLLALAGISYLLYLLFTKVESNSRRKAFNGLIFLVPLFLIITLLLSSRYRYLNDENKAILMQGIELKESPDSRSNTLEEIDLGIKVTIIDQIDDWSKIQLSNQLKGWVENTKIEKI